MTLALNLLLTWLLACFLSAEGTHTTLGPQTGYHAACVAIEAAFSGTNSSVFYSGSPNYDADINLNNQGNVERSVCSVEPSTAEDVGKILRIVSSTKTPFAVKSGGHSMNPGFSSTSGVQLALSRFDQVIYDAETQTVVVGPGQIWDKVYTSLEPYNVTVVGGRSPGVGVGGLLLGGGYSWKTNQHGLAIDNILAFTLVLPSGKVVNVTLDSYPDLFFALKGGGNNFGIVVSFVLKAHTQGAVWGGYVIYGPDQVDAVLNATAKFQVEATDPKAQMLMGIISTPQTPAPIAEIQVFYDEPHMPQGVFDDFLAIPMVSSNVSTQSFVSFFTMLPDSAAPSCLYESIPLGAYTAPLLKAMANETAETAKIFANHSASFVGYLAEPFLPTYLSHAQRIPGFPPSAYPSSRDAVLMPSDANLVWNDSSADVLAQNTLIESGLKLRNIAVTLGQTVADPRNVDAVKYPNYAAYGTRVEQIYGRNLPLLRRIKEKYDPHNVMGLAGGFKL